MSACDISALKHDAQSTSYPNECRPILSETEESGCQLLGNIAYALKHRKSTTVPSREERPLNFKANKL